MNMTYNEVYASTEGEQQEAEPTQQVEPVQEPVVQSQEGALSKEEFAQAVKESLLSLESLMVTTNSLLLEEKFTPEAKKIAAAARDTIVLNPLFRKTDVTYEAAMNDLPEKLGYGTRFMETLKKDIVALNALLGTV